MELYRKKPVVIEAMQSTGEPENNRAIIEWTSGSKTPAHMDKRPTTPEVGKTVDKECLTINTLEGAHWVSVGDWVIKGVHGEFYPCKPDIFAETYDPADFVPVKPKEMDWSKFIFKLRMSAETNRSLAQTYADDGATNEAQACRITARMCGAFAGAIAYAIDELSEDSG